MALSGGSRFTPIQIAQSLGRAGATPSQAATLAGVLHYESGGYTGSFGYQGSERGGALNPSGAFGLAQFNGSRQNDLLNFAGSPSAAANLDTQTAFIYQEAQGRGINLDSHADIVNRYEVPRVDLRAGEIASAQRISSGIDQSQIGAPLNSSSPTSATGSSGLITDPNLKISADGKSAEAVGTEGEMTANEAPNSPLGVIRIRPQNSAPQTSGNAGTGNGGASGGSSAGGSFTVPQAIDTQTRGNASDTASLNSQSKSNTDALNKTATSNTEALNKTSTANTKTGVDAANTLYNAATGSLSDYFIRFVFIVVGIIALVGALMLFSKPKQLIQQVAKAAL